MSSIPTTRKLRKAHEKQFLAHSLTSQAALFLRSTQPLTHVFGKRPNLRVLPPVTRILRAVASARVKCVIRSWRDS